MEPGWMAFQNLSDLLQWLNGSGFRIYMLNRYQQGILPERLAEILRPDLTLPTDRKTCHLIPLLLQPAEGISYRAVLCTGCNEMALPGLPRLALGSERQNSSIT